MYPEIHLTSSLSISTYFLVISGACILASLWFIRRADWLKLSRISAIDFTLSCFVGGFIGARLLHVAYEDPIYYSQNLFRVLQVWQGGFVYLGGVMGAAIAAWIYCDWRREPFWLWADVAAPPIAFGYALGRIACFLNGCCYGRLCKLPWAVFQQGRWVHPTQIYAVLWELLVLGVLLKCELRLKTPGKLFGLWLILHACGRVMMENFRDDARGPLIWGATLAIWMSLGLGLAGAALMLQGIWERQKE